MQDVPRVPPFDRPATYDDLLKVPERMVAEIVSRASFTRRRDRPSGMPSPARRSVRCCSAHSTAQSAARAAGGLSTSRNCTWRRTSSSQTGRAGCARGCPIYRMKLLRHAGARGFDLEILFALHRGAGQGQQARGVRAGRCPIRLADRSRGSHTGSPASRVRALVHPGHPRRPRNRAGRPICRGRNPPRRHLGRGVSDGAASSPDMRPCRPSMASLAPPLPRAASSARRWYGAVADAHERNAVTACGSCRTCGRKGRAHKVLGKPPTVFHSYHTPYPPVSTLGIAPSPQPLHGIDD